MLLLVVAVCVNFGGALALLRLRNVKLKRSHVGSSDLLWICMNIPGLKMLLSRPIGHLCLYIDQILLKRLNMLQLLFFDLLLL